MNKKPARNGADAYADATFRGYKGDKRWRVNAPSRAGITVAAPDEASAIAAAANYWGEVWQEYDFYAFCDVRPATKEERRPR